MYVMVPKYGKVWYDDKSIENILSLTNLVKKYRVTYDSQGDNNFNVNTNRGIIKFIRNKRGLYVLNTTYTTETYNVFTTVKENTVGFTSIPIERGKLSRKIYSIVGLTTVKNFKHILSTIMISNFPISAEYIINAENIYGP